MQRLPHVQFMSFYHRMLQNTVIKSLTSAAHVEIRVQKQQYRRCTTVSRKYTIKNSRFF